MNLILQNLFGISLQFHRLQSINIRRKKSLKRSLVKRVVAMDWWIFEKISHPRTRRGRTRAQEPRDSIGGECGRVSRRLLLSIHPLARRYWLRSRRQRRYYRHSPVRVIFDIRTVAPRRRNFSRLIYYRVMPLAQTIIYFIYDTNDNTIPG